MQADQSLTHSWPEHERTGRWRSGSRLQAMPVDRRTAAPKKPIRQDACLHNVSRLAITPSGNLGSRYRVPFSPCPPSRGEEEQGISCYWRRRLISWCPQAGMWVIGVGIGVCLCVRLSLLISASHRVAAVSKGGNQWIGRGTADGEVHFLDTGTAAQRHSRGGKVTATDRPDDMRFHVLFLFFFITTHARTRQI